MADGETIVAIATPPGTGAVSMIRLSGARAVEIGKEAFGGRLPEVRRATLVKLSDGDGAMIDEGVACVYEGPASYTGEDVVEFSGHGGVVVTRQVMERFVELGARPAEPGEYTQRAFLNGRLDLTQAEAVMDLISAQTGLALRSAREQLAGHLGEACEGMRQALIEVVAHLEAFIDFPEEDIDPETGDVLAGKMRAVSEQCQSLLATADQGRILREGARTVIYGKPNAGKSSLLNRLLGFDRAIVNAKAGTTRDMIEEVANVRGIPLRLIDTAGVREAEDEIEKQGIEIAETQLERADLVLEIHDLSEPRAEATFLYKEGLNRILVLNKSDEEHESWKGEDGLRISCLTGEGLEKLCEQIAEALSLDGGQWGEHAVAVNARHQACLKKVVDSLGRAIAGMNAGQECELVSIDVREAMAAVGDVSGVVDTEEILGEIFGSFCIGK